MKKRSSLEIKKQILKYLKKNGSSSLKKLDTKLRSSFRSIKIQVSELEFFGAVELVRQEKNPLTGRPSTDVRITSLGKGLV